MKKTAWRCAFSLAVFFLPFFASAQSGPTIILSQGQLDATSTQHSGVDTAQFVAQVGNGWSGNASSTVVAAKINGINVGTGQMVRVDIDAYASSTYTTSVATCTYDSTGLTGNYDGFIQLSHLFQNINNGCTFDPSLFYTVTVLYHDAGWSHIGQYYGSLTNSKGWNWSTTGGPAGFYAMFDVLGTSWALIPTTTSSGVFFSGAVDTCNGLFASSTGIGATIGNGLCIAAGFLFIPNSQSVQSFFDIPQTLAQTFPFSWGVQARGILQNETASSTGDTFLNLHVSVGATTSSFYIADVPLISTSSLAGYAGWDNVRLTLRNILAVSFYLLALYAIYETIAKIWYKA